MRWAASLCKQKQTTCLTIEVTSPQGANLVFLGFCSGEHGGHCEMEKTVDAIEILLAGDGKGHTKMGEPLKRLCSFSYTIGLLSITLHFENWQSWTYFVYTKVDNINFYKSSVSVSHYSGSYNLGSQNLREHLGPEKFIGLFKITYELTFNIIRDHKCVPHHYTGPFQLSRQM